MTMEPTPIFAHLDVFTPSSDRSQQPPKDPPSLIRIGVHGDGYTFDGVSVPFAQLDGFLSRLAQASTTQSVLIQCALDSPHGNLVQLLNVCAKYGLSNLSVVSAN
jgi:biopolymer transport protein ExbD